jgi:hypothetical protein
MKRILSMTTILALMVLMAIPVEAQTELPDPGITPDSPFYFMDRLFDVFQSAEAIADERASEMVAMAQKENAEGLEIAREGYERAMEKRQQEAEEDENTAEEVVQQSSNHMAVLARVREEVSEQTRAGIDQAINESARGRENALTALKRKNPNRAGAVAKETLERVMKNAPEQALSGLQRAIEAGRKGEPKEKPEKSSKDKKSKEKDSKEAQKKGGKPSDIQEEEQESAEEIETELEGTETERSPGERGKSTDTPTGKEEEESGKEKEKASKGKETKGPPEDKPGGKP